MLFRIRYQGRNRILPPAGSRNPILLVNFRNLSLHSGVSRSRYREQRVKSAGVRSRNATGNHRLTMVGKRLARFVSRYRNGRMEDNIHGRMPEPGNLPEMGRKSHIAVPGEIGAERPTDWHPVEPRIGQRHGLNQERAPVGLHLRDAKQRALKRKYGISVRTCSLGKQDQVVTVFQPANHFIALLSRLGRAAINEDGPLQLCQNAEQRPRLPEDLQLNRSGTDIREAMDASPPALLELRFLG